ncbi:MAG: hypothetical protein ABS43_01765 [Bordetella sp. SCN 67-23]|nr:hypothetical protein [Burkholderiales bacterium]ODS76297.1 MAG: hypothetical protein ABS43_01765 [Bordetella sp. SCN 67-23]OJW90100.1 MAG: hypothetical protein BGO71_27700 [Burkholderiales bacterium 67-32]
MGWDPSVFKDEFVAAGIWVPAVVTIGSVVHDPVYVGYTEPRELILGGAVMAAGYSIEFEAGDLPGLALHDQVVVAGKIFRLSQPPRARGEGFFSVAELELVA